MSRAIPTHAYVDTSVVVAAIFPMVPHGAASAAFCDGLADQETTVYFSQVLRLEPSQAIRNLATRPGQPRPDTRMSLFQTFAPSPSGVQRTDL